MTLDKLSESERQEVFEAFGPDEDMQLFGRGLRRRLPSMLDGNQKRIRMAYSLLFALPGTPVLFYGEEIGMGENLAIEGRMSVRSPMQWTDEEHGGLLEGSPLTPPKACGRGTLRTAGGQRRDATSRPRLPPQLDGTIDPTPAGDAGARLGDLDGARNRC